MAGAEKRPGMTLEDAITLADTLAVATNGSEVVGQCYHAEGSKRPSCVRLRLSTENMCAPCRACRLAGQLAHTLRTVKRWKLEAEAEAGAP